MSVSVPVPLEEKNKFEIVAGAQFRVDAVMTGMGGVPQHSTPVRTVLSSGPNGFMFGRDPKPLPPPFRLTREVRKQTALYYYIIAKQFQFFKPTLFNYNFWFEDG